MLVANRLAVNVGELCIREVATASPNEGVRAAARRMRDRDLGTLLVIDPLRRPLGIVTDRDLMVRCIAQNHDPAHTRLGEVMSGPVAWIHEDASLEEAIDEMARLRVRRLPVVDPGERLVGILALDDVLLRSLPADSNVAGALRATM